MTSTVKLLFAALSGILYIAAGLAMIASALVPAVAELTAPIIIPPDPVGGFVLCVIGTVFIFAFRSLSAASSDGHAFLYVGMTLAVIFGTVALLSRGAQGVEVLIFGKGESWDPLQLAVPMLWLALLPAFGLFTWGRAFVNDLTGG
jgi:hypothetical protein